MHTKLLRQVQVLEIKRSYCSSRHVGKTILYELFYYSQIRVYIHMCREEGVGMEKIFTYIHCGNNGVLHQGNK